MCGRGAGRLRKPSYIRTSVYSACSAKLQEQNIVLITGDMGSGKTALATELLEERNTSMGHCFQVQTPEELLFATSAKTVLIDNIFGQYAEDVAMTQWWYETMQKLEQMSKRVAFILTSRSDIYFRCKDRKGFAFLKKYEFDISFSNLTPQEKERVEKEYELPTSVSDLGLFQRCEIWHVLRNLTSTEDASMISRTSLDDVFSSMATQNRDQYFTILITLVLGNKICETDLAKPIICEVAKCIGHVQNKKKLQNVTKTAIQNLSDSLLQFIDGKYRLRNNVVFDVAGKHFLTRHPDLFIKYSEITFLDVVSIHFDIINEVHIKLLCKRLSTEVAVLTKKRLFNLLKNERTLREFIDVLLEKEDALNMFLNSDFFRFTCWSDSVLNTELLLRRMKDKRSIIENALDCCSETVHRALKKHLNAHSSGATAIPSSPIIIEEWQEPFVNTLAFDALECQISEFPRLRYHNKLMKGLADRFAKLQTEIAELKIINFVHWKKTNENPVIYFAGKDPNRSFSFATRGHRREARITMKGQRHTSLTFSEFKERSPSCILYSCGNETSKHNLLTQIRKLSVDVATSTLTSVGPCVIIVLKHEKHKLSTTDFKDMSVNGVQIVTSADDSDLLEYLTSAFEIMMIEYIKLLQTKLCFEFTPSTKHIGSLKTESDAVVKRLHLASNLPKGNSDIPASMSIPEAVLIELDKNADKIYGYGFRPDEFYVLVSDSLSSMEKDTLRRKILESKERANLERATIFPWKIKFENSRGVKITKHFGSGSPLLSDQTNLDRYGTLGGFAQINSKDVVGLTNYHVIGKNIVAYVKDGDTLVKLGKSTLVFVPGKESLADVSLIEVEKGVLNMCQKPLVDDEDEPKNATVYLGTLDQICPAIVHKKGASTGITQGTVVSIMTYRDVLGDRETQSAFLVEDTEKPFSAPGDSGSIVFQNSLSASQEDIEVVAILNGRYKSHEEEEESHYVLCSNMTYVYEKLHEMGKQLQFFKREELH